jgi:hypothetical protein
MVFLGTTFCSGKNALSSPPIKPTTIFSVKISDGIYNHLYLSTDGNFSKDDVGIWDYNTKVNASFDKDLEGGSSTFALTTTDTIVIRRREVGQNKWTVIYVKEINTKEDFNIHFIDKYARAETEYEYSISSFINGVENGYIIQNVYSDFDGFYITDKDCLYGTIYDVDGCDTSRNIILQTLKMLNSKYMHVVSNSELNCDSGSISGSFFKIDEDSYTVDKYNSLKYRNDLKNRLANHKPLILKVQDGRIWIIRVVGGIDDSSRGHVDLRKISFEWVEIGDINDMETLYRLGFSDVDSRWW